MRRRPGRERRSEGGRDRASTILPVSNQTERFHVYSGTFERFQVPPKFKHNTVAAGALADATSDPVCINQRASEGILTKVFRIVGRPPLRQGTEPYRSRQS